jgi:hypothetical protein
MKASSPSFAQTPMNNDEVTEGHVPRRELLAALLRQSIPEQPLQVTDNVPLEVPAIRLALVESIEYI